MSAAWAAETFPEAAFRPHRRTPLSSAAAGSPNSNKKRGGTTNSAILRATGDILVPEALAAHVEFVSGLTELWVPDVPGRGMGKLDGAGAGRFGSVDGMEVRMYNWRFRRGRDGGGGRERGGRWHTNTMIDRFNKREEGETSLHDV